MTSQLLDFLKRSIGENRISTGKEPKSYYVTFSQELKISLKELEPGVALFTEVFPIPLKKREELFSLCMRANFLHQGTGGGVLGIDPDEKFLTLSHTIPYEMELQSFKETLEDFANFADYWRAEAQKVTEEEGPLR